MTAAAFGVAGFQSTVFALHCYYGLTCVRRVLNRALDEARVQAEKSLSVVREEYDAKVRDIQSQLRQQCARAQEFEAKVAELQESSAGLNRALAAERETISMLEGELQRRQQETKSADTSPRSIDPQPSESATDQRAMNHSQTMSSDVVTTATAGNDDLGDSSSASDISGRRSRQFDEIQASRTRANALAHRVEGTDKVATFVHV